MPPSPEPLVSVEARNLHLLITTDSTGYARVLDADNASTGVGADSGAGGRDLVIRGPSSGPPGQVHLDLRAGIDVYLDLEGCTVTTGLFSNLGRAEVRAQASTVHLGQVSELGGAMTASDVSVHVRGRRLAARLTAAGLSAHLDRPEWVGLGGEASTVTLYWAEGARERARYTDKTTQSRIHHTSARA